jgi:hypothetical protein
VTAKRKFNFLFSWGKKKKGDEVEDENDDMVRTSMSKDRVTATL